MDKQQYNEMLKKNICIVVFTKKNGEERTMRCTLQDYIIEDYNLVPVLLYQMTKFAVLMSTNRHGEVSLPTPLFLSEYKLERMLKHTTIFNGCLFPKFGYNDLHQPQKATTS